MTGSLYMSGSAVSRRVSDVEVITLDDVFERFAIERCDLLKLDCEGGEYEILLGARPETLLCVRHVALEYHVGLTPHRPEELVVRLQELGFDVRLVASPTDVVHGYLYASRAPVRPELVLEETPVLFAH